MVSFYKNLHWFIINLFKFGKRRINGDWFKHVWSNIIVRIDLIKNFDWRNNDGGDLYSAVDELKWIDSNDLNEFLSKINKFSVIEHDKLICFILFNPNCFSFSIKLFDSMKKQDYLFKIK